MANIRATRRRIVADDDIEDVDVDIEEEVPEEEVGEILFETDDVAELLAEVTGEDVEVTIDDEETGEVTFGIGDAEYQVTPDAGAELVTSARRTPRHKRTVSASTRAHRTTTTASRNSYRRPTTTSRSRSTTTRHSTHR